MDTVISNGSQPTVVSHDKGHHNDNYGYHLNHEIRDHALHNNSSQERFGLKTLDELCNVRKEMGDIKHEFAVRVLEDGQRTRDLMRDQEANRMREDLITLRMQLVAAGIAPATFK